MILSRLSVFRPLIYCLPIALCILALYLAEDESQVECRSLVTHINHDLAPYNSDGALKHTNYFLASSVPGTGLLLHGYGGKKKKKGKKYGKKKKKKSGKKKKKKKKKSKKKKKYKKKIKIKIKKKYKHKKKKKHAKKDKYGKKKKSKKKKKKKKKKKGGYGK